MPVTNLVNSSFVASGIQNRPDGSLVTSGGNGFSGGTAALSWSAPEGVADGNALTITTDGTYDFGTKPQAAPVLWVFGSEIYENGVLNTSEAALNDGEQIPSGASAVWASATGSTVKRVGEGRLPEFDSAYFSDTGLSGGEPATLFYPNVQLAVAGDRNSSIYNGSLFCSFRYKYSAQPYRYRIVEFESLSGSFDTGSDFYDAGEQIELLGEYGNVYYVDTVNNLIAFQGDGLGSANSSSMQDQTLTGQTSGATCVLRPDLTYSTPYATKFLRWMEHVSSDLAKPRISGTWSPTGGIVSGADGQTEAYRQNLPSIQLPTAEVTDWVRGELWQDNRGATGNGYMQFGSVKEEFSNFDLTKKSSEHGLMVGNLGLDVPGSPAPLYFQNTWGEVYLDTSPARVVIGNAATWDAVTDVEFTRPTSWSNNQIEVIYKAGLGWLYAVDDNGDVVNTNGVAINA